MIQESQPFSTDDVQRRYRYSIRIRDSHPVGRFVGHLSIRTIRGDWRATASAGEIPIEDTFRPRLYADPKRLFGIVSTGELPAWELSLRHNDAEPPCRLVSIKCDAGWLQAKMLDKTEAAASDDNSLGRLSVKVVHPPPGRSAKTTVVAKTDSPQCREIRIPVTIARIG